MTATLTPYACAKIVNNELKAKGVEKTLPPQMFYTYVKKGYIPSTDKKVNIVDLQKWFNAYLQRTLGQSPETTEEVVPDNDGTIGEWTDASEGSLDES